MNFDQPPDDVEWDALEATAVRTRCEWKGIATAYDVLIDGERIAGTVGFPLPGVLIL